MRVFVAKFSFMLGFACLILSSPVASTIETASCLTQVQQSPSPTPTPLHNGSLPVVSPDGSRIAFTSDRGGVDDLFVIGADGSNERQLTIPVKPKAIWHGLLQPGKSYFQYSRKSAAAFLGLIPTEQTSAKS